MPEIYFASPGDPNTITGGYLYNHRVREGLRALGWCVHELRLPDGFPFPSADDFRETSRLLARPNEDAVIVIDGLALGAFDEGVLNAIRGRIVALVHHPLAEETGLEPTRVEALFESEKNALRAVSGVLVSSPHTQQSLVDRYDVPECKISVAIPGVDRPASRDGVQSSTCVANILSVGTLTPRKGHDVLLAALGQISDLDWSATIAGNKDRDPATAEHLLAQCRELELQDRVVFAGECSATALRNAYDKATVFALATRHEGYGMVFSEAMVHGLPIVSCLAGAVPETVPQNAGILVQPDNVVQLSHALRRMLTDAPFREMCGEASRIAGQSLPTWNDTARVFANTLHEVMKA